MRVCLPLSQNLGRQSNFLYPLSPLDEISQEAVTPTQRICNHILPSWPHHTGTHEIGIPELRGPMLSPPSCPSTPKKH